MGKFPTGVTIVTTVEENSQFVGITVSSFVSVSLQPALILFCLANDALRSQFFLKPQQAIGINILSRQQENLSQLFASHRAVNWSDLDYDLGDNKTPLFKDSSATLEAKVIDIYPGGDHQILLCNIEKINNQAGFDPLIYYSSNYCSLA